MSRSDRDTDARAVQIREAARSHFGRQCKVRCFQLAPESDTYGVLMAENAASHLVCDWRIKYDQEIGFADEAVGLTAEEAKAEYDRRVGAGLSTAENNYLEIGADPADEPIELDVEDAFGGLVDCAGERYRVVVADADGLEIATVAGPMIPPESYEQEGGRLARFGISRERMEATIRVPMDPDSQCSISPDGTLTGTLPNGASWSIVPLR